MVTREFSIPHSSRFRIRALALELLISLATSSPRPFRRLPSSVAFPPGAAHRSRTLSPGQPGDGWQGSWRWAPEGSRDLPDSRDAGKACPHFRRKSPFSIHGIGVREKARSPGTFQCLFFLCLSGVRTDGAPDSFPEKPETPLSAFLPSFREMPGEAVCSYMISFLLLILSEGVPDQDEDFPLPLSGPG